MSFLSSKPQLEFQPDLLPRRRLQFSSALLFVVGIAAMILQLNGWEHAFTLSIVTMVAGVWLMSFAPIRRLHKEHVLDERDHAIRVRSFMIGGHAALGAVMISILILAVRSDNADAWLPNDRFDWWTAAYVLMTLWITATIFSSTWKNRYRTDAEQAAED